MMEINNKYDIGDVVYFFHDNRVQRSKVSKIEITVSDKTYSIRYALRCVRRESWGGISMYTNEFKESLLHPTLDSIKEHITKIDNILDNILEE